MVTMSDNYIQDGDARYFCRKQTKNRNRKVIFRAACDNIFVILSVNFISSLMTTPTSMVLFLLFRWFWAGAFGLIANISCVISVFFYVVFLCPFYDFIHCCWQTNIAVCFSLSVILNVELSSTYL